MENFQGRQGSSRAHKGMAFGPVHYGVIKLCLAKVFFHRFSGNFSSLDSFVLFSFIITYISNNLDVMVSFVLYIAIPNF